MPRGRMGSWAGAADALEPHASMTALHEKTQLRAVTGLVCPPAQQMLGLCEKLPIQSLSVLLWYAACTCQEYKIAAGPDS